MISDDRIILAWAKLSARGNEPGEKPPSSSLSSEGSEADDELAARSARCLAFKCLCEGCNRQDAVNQCRMSLVTVGFDQIRQPFGVRCVEHECSFDLMGCSQRLIRWRHG